MMPSIAVVTLLIATTGCIEVIDWPENDCFSTSDRQSPACGGPVPGPASAALRPFPLGDSTQTTWVASGGTASIWIDAQRLDETVVRRNEETLVRESAGTWRLSDAAKGDALRITGSNTTMSEDFSTTLALNVDDVETVDIVQRGAFAIVELRSAAGDRLIDTTLRLEEETSEGIEQVDWDRLSLFGPGTYTVVLTGASIGERTLEVEIPGSEIR
jgi:hypothetical protein